MVNSNVYNNVNECNPTSHGFKLILAQFLDFIIT